MQRQDDPLRLRLDSMPTATYAGKMTMFSDDSNKVRKAISLLPEGSKSSDHDDKKQNSIGFFANESRINDMQEIVKANDQALGKLTYFMTDIDDIKEKIGLQ